VSAASEGPAEYIPDYETYDYESEWQGRAIEDRAEKELIGRLVEPGESGLELGGGYGRLTAVLERNFERMFMVDYSSRNLSKASERLVKTKLVRTSISKLPFHDNTFDSVIAVRVLHHLPRLEDAIGEMTRVARDGASIIIGVPNTGRKSVGCRNTLVATGPQGHRIYSAPLEAYSHSLLERTEVRGLGIFDNRLGRRLHMLSLLSALDLATCSVWTLKPELFIKFRVKKEGVRNEPVVICGCGADLDDGACARCGVSYGKIIDLTKHVN
jgi:ubiquinone/menaquinone biosynthesis C-methylase UbiE